MKTNEAFAETTQRATQEQDGPTHTSVDGPGCKFTPGPGTVPLSPSELRYSLYGRMPGTAKVESVFAGLEILTKPELEGVKKIQARIDALRVQLSKYGYDKVGVEQRQAKIEYTKNPTDENLKKWEAFPILDHSEARKRMKDLMAPIRHTIIDTQEEGAIFLKPILAKLVALALAHLEKMADKERDLAKFYGVPFAPSGTLCGIYNLAAMFERRPLSPQDPRQFLAGIVKL